MIDNLVRIRTLLDEHVTDSRESAGAPSTKELLGLLSLCRELEGRLAPFGREFGPDSYLRIVATQTWDRRTLDAAIDEAVTAIESV